MKKVLAVIALFAIAVMSNILIARAEDPGTSPLPAKSLTAVSVVITPVQGGMQMQATRAYADGSTQSQTDPVKTLDEGLDAGVKWMMGEKSLPSFKTN